MRDRNAGLQLDTKQEHRKLYRRVVCSTVKQLVCPALLCLLHPCACVKVGDRMKITARCTLLPVLAARSSFYKYRVYGGCTCLWLRPCPPLSSRIFRPPRHDPWLLFASPPPPASSLSFSLASTSCSRSTSWATPWRTPRSSPSSADTPHPPRRAEALVLTRPHSRWPGWSVRW